ncbi:hypothetical protein [Paenibacillus validus]|uniref:YtkA-like domain-containing protein n=1 Tax=Paenibacillus validus TaxID=44253 RepID=A0A7X2ZBL3_9BACL|nr:hypothetical protein [Paenibacillus validus]MUG71970.1 hypothetical protein [Paenibacillus validus]
MSKRILLLLLMSVLLTACGPEPSWENENVSVASNRIMADNVKAVWTLDEGKASEAGKGTLIRIEIKKDDGERIDKFELNHEKLLHLIVIGKDLAYFNHIHPEYKGDGVFEIENDFPAGGEYRLIADFKPAGGDSMTKMEWVRIEGKRAEPVPVVPDASLEKIVDGKRVTLSIDQLEPKKESKLTFTLADEQTNQPITDLEPYLGAIGHVVILSEDGERYVHVHADEGQATGPDAYFETTFPRSGVYKVWGQFQRDNQVFTVSFVVKVP